MFAGLIQAVGKIISVNPQAEGVRLTVDISELPPPALHIGDSLAINGACMTVETIAANTVTVFVSAHSLSRCVGLDFSHAVNLESSLRIGDAIGGHFVSGHVDAVATVHTIKNLAQSSLFTLFIPTPLHRLMAEKGSIAVNGVSLTINQVVDQNGGCMVEINLIPHTLQNTTLGVLQPNDKVNVEADLLARYITRYQDSAE